MCTGVKRAHARLDWQQATLAAMRRQLRQRPVMPTRTAGIVEHTVAAHVVCNRNRAVMPLTNVQPDFIL